MSATLSVVRDGIYELMRDTNPFDRAVDPLTAARVIVHKAQEIGGRVGYGPEWVASAFTLVSGSLDDYNLPSALQYSQVQLMRIPATGLLIRRTSLEAVNRLRNGIVTGTGPGGDPTWFAIWEDASQVLKIRINTVPDQARQIDVFRSAIMASTYTDGTVLPFSDPLLRVIEKAVALELLASLTQEERSRLRLNPEVAELWAADVQTGIRLEQERRSRLRVATREPYGTKSYGSLSL